jgi:hypothetical protein
MDASTHAGNIERIYHPQSEEYSRIYLSAAK